MHRWNGECVSYHELAILLMRATARGWYTPLHRRLLPCALVTTLNYKHVSFTFSL